MENYIPTATLTNNEEKVIITKSIDNYVTDFVENIHFLPYYGLTKFLKDEVIQRRKELIQKLKTGKVIDDKENIIPSIRKYIDFLISKYSSKPSLLYINNTKELIYKYLNKILSCKDKRLKTLYLSQIQSAIIKFVDSCYFETEMLEWQIENNTLKIENNTFRLINDLLNFNIDNSIDESHLISIIDEIFFNCSNIDLVGKSDSLNNRQILIIKTKLPFSEFIFEVKNKITKGNLKAIPIYFKYNSKNNVIVCDFIGFQQEKHLDIFNAFSKKVYEILNKEDVNFNSMFTKFLGDIWDNGLAYQNIERRKLNYFILTLMSTLEDVWTQDHTVSLAVLIFGKIIHDNFDKENADLIIQGLKYEWYYSLYNEYKIRDINSFISQDSFVFDNISKHVQSMKADIELLSTYVKNDTMNYLIGEVVNSVNRLLENINKNSQSFLFKRIFLDIIEEIAQSMGVLQKNRPYIAMLIEEYKEQLWKIF